MGAVEFRQLIESGNEPEYFVTDICKHEPMKNGMVRLYVGSERAGHFKLEYTAIVPTASLAAMGRLCLQISADVHNLDIFTEGMSEN